MYQTDYELAKNEILNAKEKIKELFKIKYVYTLREILKEVKNTGAAVIVEEHSKIGGLAEGIASLLSEKYPIPIKKVCVDDIFPGTVTVDETDVYKKFNISREEIVDSVKECIRMKN